MLQRYPASELYLCVSLLIDNQKPVQSSVSTNNNQSLSADKKNDAKRDESDSLNWAAKLKQDAEELERRKREGLLQLCHQNAM